MIPNDPLGWAEVTKLVFTGGVVWSAAWLLFNQANRIKSLIYNQIAILNTTFSEKLEYHERHDDERFEQLRKDLWQIRVQNAAKHGKEAQE